MPDSPNVLLMHGPDEFAVTAHVDKLQAALGDPSSAGMNLARFDGRLALDLEALNTAVNAVPFLSPRRLVVLAHPSSAFPSPEARKKLFELLDHLPPTTTLVLVEAELLKPEHWLMKWARQAKGRAEVRACPLPKRWEMTRWIEREAQKQGGRIEAGAADRLGEMTGEDTRLAAQEITKLLTYADYARPVTAADVEQVSVASAQASIFDLVDALGTGNGHQAQKVLHRRLEDEEPFELWGMVIRQFRLLLLAREILDGGGSPAEVQKGLGLRDFVAQKVTNQARRFSMAALESIYHRLLEIDEGAKTSQFPLDLALDSLIVELTAKTS